LYRLIHLRLGQSAWVRTDSMVRDVHSGALRGNNDFRLAFPRWYES
jgi:hypothetical protein